jgi:predicted ATPase
VSFAHGQCIEQYGAGEAYLPVLEALGRMGRQPEGARLIAILEQYAPTWLVQLSTLLSAAELEAVQRRVQGATRERMLREIAEAVERLNTEHPLVLVLEDLHWSDSSTVELLAMLARRREKAQLLVLGTYRPVELIVTNHPLKAVKQELIARGQGSEVLLGGLNRDAVQTYITQHVGEDVARDEVARFVHKRTEGHPLFMVQVTDYLRQQNLLQALSPAVTQAVPTGLQQLIEVQLERLTPDEQQVLAIASVAGAEFTVATVTTGLQDKSEIIETLCEGLARGGQFIDDRGVLTWPDGTISERCGFRHALYQEVLYTRLPEARRIRWHRVIGERIEKGYDERASEVAAELAVHFERGHDRNRTALYLQKAGENALRRYAYPEALGHFHKSAEFRQTLPQTTDRARRELVLQFLLIQALAAVKGHASTEVERAYLHARTLCEEVGTTQQLFSVLLGLFRLHHGRCEYLHAREFSAQCLALAQRAHDPALFFPAYYILGANELFLGNFAAAEDYFTQGIRCHDMRHDATYVALYGNASPYPFCHGYAAMALWFLGYPDQALQGTAAMLTMAKELASPLIVAGTRGFAPLVYHCCRQGAQVQAQAEEGIAVATHVGFPLWRAIGLFWRGWGLAEQGHYEEGIEQMQQGLSAQRETGSSVHRAHLLVLLAQAYGRAGQCAEGLRLLAEAETEMKRTDECFYEAELWRIKGELTLQLEARDRRRETSPPSLQAPCLNPLVPSGVQAEVEGFFLKAIAVARTQQAKSLELRAVTSLVRLRQLQASPHESRTALAEAHRMLRKVYHWFTEGFETKDLQEAKALLEELSD